MTGREFLDRNPPRPEPPSACRGSGHMVSLSVPHGDGGVTRLLTFREAQLLRDQLSAALQGIEKAASGRQELLL